MTTGMAPSVLSPKQLLSVIDCLEGFLVTRKRYLGKMELASNEKGAAGQLREVRRGVVARECHRW